MDILDAAVKANQGTTGGNPGVANSSTAAKAASGGADILSMAVQANKDRPAPVKPLTPPTATPPAPGADFSLPQNPLGDTPPAPTQTSTPATKTPTTLQEVLGNLKQVPGIAWDVATAIPKALLNSEINPSPEELALEKNLPNPSNGVLKALTYIPNLATKVVSRLIQPAMQPFSEDVAAAVLAPTFAQEVAAGNMSYTDFEAKFPALQKSNLQVISDTAMAVLSAYTPELLADGVAGAASKSAMAALKVGSLNGAVAGALFGTTQVISAKITDPKQIAKVYAENIIGGTLLGGIMHAAIPFGKEGFEKITKDVETKYGIPEHVYIDPTKVKSIFQTGDKISPQELDMVKALGLTPEQYRQAFREGLSIEIPARNITTITDKPYWAQVKDAFGFKPTDKVITADAKPQMSERILSPNRQLPSPDDIRAELAKGKTAAQVTHEIAKDVPIAEAQKAVEEAQAQPAKPEEIAAPEKPAGQVMTELPRSVDESVLNKTPAEYQQDFASVQNTHEEKVQALESKITDLQKQVEAAKPQSIEKKNLKVALSQAKADLQTEKQNHTESSAAHASSLHDFLANHISQEHGIHPETANKLAGKVTDHITNPDLVASHGGNSLRTIASSAVMEHRTESPMTRGEKVLMNDGKIGKVVRPVRMEDGSRGREVEIKKGVTKVIPESELRKAPNQKEVIKEAVAKKGTAKAGEIAKDTKILEPNVRRILGLGAKEGEFERVADGVYKVKTPDGKDVAYVIPGDALKELPRLAKEGFKADMVFLDIPYKTKAVSGGNRGVEYNLITPAEFNHVLRAVNSIVRGDASSVLYMFSQAKSGLEEMGKYTSLFEHYGFKPVARGEWQKLFQNGKPVTNVRGKVAEPEGIILFNKSGIMPEGKEAPNLGFKLVRPKGYQTEKPAEMLKALIEMTTKEGETVLDPFAGSGVTAAEAVKAGRKAVAIEKNPEQAKKIAERVQKEAANDVLAQRMTAVKSGKLDSIFDEKKTGEMGKRELIKAGFDPEALGFGDSATVKYIDGKPAVAFDLTDEGLAGISVAKDFRGRGIATDFVRQLMKDEGGKLDVIDANESMLGVLRKIGEVTKPDGRGVVTVTAKAESEPKMYPTIHEGGVVKMIEGEPVKIIDGIETFLHEGDGGWIVSEASTGRYIAESRSKDGAIAKAHFNIDDEEKFRQLIKQHRLPESSIEVAKKGEKVNAAMIPEDAKSTPNLSMFPEEKVPREPKPKVEKKAPEPKKVLDPKEMFNVEQTIDQNHPIGSVAKALKEVATVFNPVGQAPSAAVDVIMRNKGEYERGIFRTEQTMRAVKKMWDGHSPETNIDFMDKVETGDFENIPAEFKDIALMYRERLDNIYAAISEFKDVPFLENYFPHLWKDPKAIEESNIWAKANARRPFQGNKSFMKHRIFATIQDGIKAGYELVTHNPEEIMQLHEQNAQKFLMANRIMADLKARGFSKLVKSGGKAKIPDGFARIEDSISKVYLNPNIPILEAYDEHVFNALNDVAESLGIKHDRKYDIGARGALGFTNAKGDTITTKFGTPLSVIAHELGHQLDFKYDLQGLFKSDPDRTYGSDSDYTQKELRKLADLRYEGHDVTDSYKQYVRSAPEKMAVMLEAYVHAPEKFQEVAPRTYEKFTEFLSKNEELRPILEIKPSLVYGVREDSIYAGGMVLGGEYWVQKDVARLINNYLSKNDFLNTAWGQGLMNTKNTMNAFELGFSAFHITMETLDTMITKFAIGLGKVASGDFGGFTDMLKAPAAPYTYFKDGQKFFNSDPAMMDLEKDLFTGGASLREKQYYKNTVFDDFAKSVREIKGMVERGEKGGIVKEVAKDVFRLPLAAIEATMRPIFNFYIPRLKVGAFRDLFAAELERPYNIKKMEGGDLTREQLARDVWNNIENRMGELNYDNLFWSRNFKTSLMLSTRAVGWNLGTAREIGGALFQDMPESLGATKLGREDFKKYGFNFTRKMGYTVSLFFFVATLGAVYEYLHTGEMPKSAKDLFYPRNGAKLANGEDYRVEFPTYLKDIYQSGVPQLLTGHPFSAADSFIKMAKNKAAPELAAIFDIMNNRDFYDNEIRNPNDSTTLQAKQLALYLVSTLTPFTLQQLVNLRQGHSTGEQQAESLLGIIKAPKEIIQSDYDKQLEKIYTNQRGGHAPETPEQQDAYDKKYQVIDQIKKGDYSGITDLVRQGVVKPSGLKTFIENALLTTPQKQYKYLSPQNKANFIQSQKNK